MSSSIWTRCAGPREFKRLRRSPWRVVESQHHVSTRKLVGSAVEQDLLEKLLERVKPPVESRGLHYLLWTPFRYPPLRHGSRFGTRDQRGIWYGAERPKTAFSESAYHRLRFLDASAARLAPLEVPVTLFRAVVSSRRAIDLMATPFDAFTDQLASPTSYADSQALGREARRAGCELLIFVSARDLERGPNVAVLHPRAFLEKRPVASQAWTLYVEDERVEARRADALATGELFVFPREQFRIRGHLPRPS